MFHSLGKNEMIRIAKAKLMLELNSIFSFVVSFEQDHHVKPTTQNSHSISFHKCYQ